MQGRYTKHQALKALGGCEHISMVTSSWPKSPFIKDETVLTGNQQLIWHNTPCTDWRPSPTARPYLPYQNGFIFPASLERKEHLYCIIVSILFSLHISTYSSLILTTSLTFPLHTPKCRKIKALRRHAPVPPKVRLLR